MVRRLHRLLYDAEAEFDKYESENADAVVRDTPRTLKEKLFSYTEMLYSFGLFLFDLSLAERIVLCELALDGVYRCPCGEIHPPPLHPPELNWAAEYRQASSRAPKRSWQPVSVQRDEGQNRSSEDITAPRRSCRLPSAVASKRVPYSNLPQSKLIRPVSLMPAIVT